MEEESVNCLNATNSQARWQSALQCYSASSAPDPESTTSTATTATTQAKVHMNTVIDVSGSMTGNKLTAVKLGLCAVIANLNSEDTINITSFSNSFRSITQGFKPVAEVKSNLAALLESIRTDSTTSLYDAAINGVESLRSHRHAVRARAVSSEDVSSDKHCLLVLTDGEDTSSRNHEGIVSRYLASPGIDNFMFVLVAVEMRPSEEAVFRDWTEMRHCKQVSVNVRTGSR